MSQSSTLKGTGGAMKNPENTTGEAPSSYSSSAPVLAEENTHNGRGATADDKDKNAKEEEEDINDHDHDDDDDPVQDENDSDGAIEDELDELASSSLDSPKEKTATEDDAKSGNLVDETIPLLYYTRVQSEGVPRPSPPPPRAVDTAGDARPRCMPFQHSCTCSLMGRILLSSDNVTGPPSTMITEEETPVLTLLQQYLPHLTSLGPEQPVELFVVVLGFANGSIAILDARTHAWISSSTPLQIRESNTSSISSSSSSSSNPQPVVALSMDATGSFLAAVDAGGMCTIFEMTKFQIQLAGTTMRTSVPATNAAAASSQANPSASLAAPVEQNVFSSFMSAITGGKAAAANNPSAAQRASAANTTATTTTMTRQEHGLMISSLQIHRIPYPRNFGMPTTVALDPAYKRRREKAVLVGFADGRLVQTKRGIIFQRRNDAVLHQALPPAPTDTNMAPGIQSLVWRGGLVAWAEPSGIRLLDADSLTKIAHVDRPVGARPSLYPSVKDMTARLCFETADRLLVAWGDCLLQLTIRESNATTAPNSNSTNTAATDGGSSSNVPDGAPVMVRRRTVECTMAWELDCIAAGVIPLDEKHVIVLGLVPNSDDDENSSSNEETVSNEVEVQVLSRMDGNVVYSDLLPILKKSPETKTKRVKIKVTGESIAPFALLSTFSIPRMNNADESSTTEMAGPEFDPVAIFAGGAVPRPVFRDSHLQWDLSFVSPDPLPSSRSADTDDGDSHDDDDTVDSVDSDNYTFVQRPLVMERRTAGSIMPPTIWVVTDSDAVSARVRNLDDAITAVQDRPAVALQRALRRRAQLRKHNLDDLINAYFAALLRLPSSDGKRLSLRRMKLAASAMPVLLGGNAKLWKQWIEALEDLPGALFILRNVLPVRDPILPRQYYTKVLQKMFEQILQMKGSTDSLKGMEKLVGEAENHFLFTLLGWGTSLGIREHLQHYKYLVGLYPSYKAPLIATEDLARRRQQQSSAAYLSFPAPSIERPVEPIGLDYLAPTGVDELRDSLYDAEALESFFEASLENNQIESEENGGRVALNAMAKLKISRGQFGAALKYILLLGSRYGSMSLDEVEDEALKCVENGLKSSTSERFPYAYVLSLIETKHLHQMLLDQSLLSGESPVPPIIALCQLVGIQLAGDFLTKHCVPVQSKKERSSKSNPKDRVRGERRGTLPLDVVAAQLEASPKILYWYLHCIFQWKPEVYVKFGSTANPPEAVTRLHRKALDLYIKYAGDQRDSVSVLRGVEAYRVAEVSTPLLSFLKVVLQLGGINPTDVAKQLQIQRKSGPGVSGIFALELAYVMDHYGLQNQENAKVVLELYLLGAQSLMLAVSFAQRAEEYRNELWQILIDHCLSADKKKTDGGNVEDGHLFGSLLEAAALSGADLAQLVTKIPRGMSIEGLRPRLVGAISDYRWKLQIHASANEVAGKEIINLFREYEHKHRRGRRYESSDRIEIPHWAKPKPESQAEGAKGRQKEEPSILSASFRPKERPHRVSLSYKLPLR